MISYWLLTVIPTLFCLRGSRRTLADWHCWLIGIFLTIFIGLRHEVGGDWFTYIRYINGVKGLTFFDTISSLSDPGFNALNWLFAPYPWAIYGVNFVSAAIFSSCLVFFCRSQPRPWLALCASIPYLVIVVAMGYTRQGVAIGLALPALMALERGFILYFILGIVAAATFHSSALIMLLFALSSISGRTLLSRFLRLAILVPALYGFIVLAYSSSIENFVYGYISLEYQSEGAAIRVAMNLFPAVLLLLWPARFHFSKEALKLWRSIAVAAVVCFIVLILFPANSTAIDRIALFLIPLQLVVISRLPGTNLFGLSSRHLLLLSLSICLLAEFVWLNFSKTSSFWLPYANAIFL